MIEVLIAAAKAVAVLAGFALCLYGLWAIVSNQPLHLTHESPPPAVGDGLSPGPLGQRDAEEVTADTGDSSPPPTERSDHADTEEPPPSTPPPDEPGPPVPTDP